MKENATLFKILEAKDHSEHLLEKPECSQAFDSLFFIVDCHQLLIRISVWRHKELKVSSVIFNRILHKFSRNQFHQLIKQDDMSKIVDSESSPSQSIRSICKDSNRCSLLTNNQLIVTLTAV